MKSRREFIKQTSLLAGSMAFLSIRGNAFADVLNDKDKFFLPKLDYGYNALEPYIDAVTMEIHHSKHHQAYVDKLNDALKANKIQGVTLKDILANTSKYPASIRNNAGGHYNHSFFWKLMSPNGSKEPSPALAEAISSSFGSIDNFKTAFNDAAKARFGSGWAWLIKNSDGKLQILSTPNQDNPLMDIAEVKGTPVLALDVWEHAYYLKYQNMRADYINAWWKVLNWQEADNNFLAK